MESQPQPWYHRPWFIIAALIILPPAGIVLLWTNKTTEGFWGSKGKRVFLTIFVACYCALFPIFLAAVSVPLFIQYVEGSRASDAQATIGAIWNACKMYRQDHSEDPASIQVLEDEGYLDIDESTLRQWEFAIIGADPIMQIQATSTAEMRGGEGHVVVYDIATGTFTGYGLPNEEGEE